MSDFERSTRFTRHCQRLLDQIREAPDQSEKRRLEQQLADAIMGKPFEDEEPGRAPGDEADEEVGF